MPGDAPQANRPRALHRIRGFASLIANGSDKPSIEVGIIGRDGFFEKWFPEKFLPYWIVAILFGAIFPTLVLWFVVFALKGQPIATG